MRSPIKERLLRLIHACVLQKRLLERLRKTETTTRAFKESFQFVSNEPFSIYSYFEKCCTAILRNVVG